MKIFIDSNILISAARNPAGKPYFAFLKAVSFPNTGLVCEQNIEEVRRAFNRKFPLQILLLERFLAKALPLLQVAPVPVDALDDEGKIRDANDRPILRAAIKAGADILLTGDRDFLESAVIIPKIMTAAQFTDGL